MTDSSNPTPPSREEVEEARKSAVSFMHVYPHLLPTFDTLLSALSAAEGARDLYLDTLRLVATGIERDPARNACWLHGAAAVVHAVESVISSPIAGAGE